MSAAPYDQLYIYEVAGDARAALGDPGPHYLGLWLEGDTSFIFFSQPAEELAREIMARGPGLRLSASHHLTYEQWQGGLSLEPLELPGLCVVPVWSDHRPGPGQRLLRLDPGLVFGNGLHPTTRHCLELLLMRADQGPLGRVLDLGCGTGILGLAASLLGAASVLAVDLNPLCVSTTRRNAQLNGLAIEVAEGPAQEFLEPGADLLLANLHWEVQQAILGEMASARGTGDLILSGLLRSQRGPLEDAVRRLGYDIVERREAENTWFTLWARRQGQDRPRPGKPFHGPQ